MLEMNKQRAATMAKILEATKSEFGLEGDGTLQLQKEDREALIELYMENLTAWEKR